MSAAPFTPRVRMLAVCDEAVPSEAEDAVFTLVGVRQHLVPETIPCYRELSVFLLLTSVRPGAYRGWIRVIQNETGKAMRFVKFIAEFPAGTEWLSVVVNVESCRFLGVWSIQHRELCGLFEHLERLRFITPLSFYGLGLRARSQVTADYIVPNAAQVYHAQVHDHLAKLVAPAHSRSL